MKNLRIPLRVVLYDEEGRWIAHCLEFDLLGDGATRSDAFESLGEAIRLQVEETVRHNNPANLFSPAIGEIFELFAAGTDAAKPLFDSVLQSLSHSPIVIESMHVREVSGSRVPVTAS